LEGSSGQVKFCLRGRLWLTGSEASTGSLLAGAGWTVNAGTVRGCLGL
jgi:hypothetical protein